MTTFTVRIQSEGENPYYTIQFLNISGLFQIRSVNPCAGNTFQFTLSSDLLFEDDPFTLSVKLYNKETGGYLLDVVTLDMTADCIQPVTGVTLDSDGALPHCGRDSHPHRRGSAGGREQ